MTAAALGNLEIAFVKRGILIGVSKVSLLPRSFPLSKHDTKVLCGRLSVRHDAEVGGFVTERMEATIRVFPSFDCSGVEAGVVLLSGLFVFMLLILLIWLLRFGSVASKLGVDGATFWAFVRVGAWVSVASLVLTMKFVAVACGW